MKIRRAGKIAMLLLLCAVQAFSQDEVPVDMYTGSPAISIPLWTVTSHDIVEPIALSYDANAALAESPYGAGWTLHAGGSISRKVKTFPDDVGYNQTKKGWFYSSSSGTIATTIGSFSPSADLSATTVFDEATDFTTINGFGYNVDTEPDIFYFNCGGVSGSFVFDNALTIRTIPYQDVKIVPEYTSTSDKTLQRFTITTNTGYVYTFAYKVSTTKTASESAYAHRDSYFNTEYFFYNPGVTFTSEWKLTRIDSPDGAYVTFGYNTQAGNTSSSRAAYIGLYEYPDPIYANPVDIYARHVYSVSEQTTKVRLSLITASDGPVAEFIYGAATLTTLNVKDTRRGTTAAEQLVKSFNFQYWEVRDLSDLYSPSNNNSVQYLGTLTETSGCESKAPHKFSYNGVVYYASDSFGAVPGYYMMSMYGTGSSEPSFPKLYIYPAEPEAERYRYYPIPNYSGQEVILDGHQAMGNSGTSGVLSSITSPEGGATSFSFETNSYLDARTDMSYTAEGLRIRSITYADGINNVPVKKTFEYVDPATGKSSGRIIRKPVYYMPAYKWKSPGGSTYDKTFASFTAGSPEAWKYLTIRTNFDLTDGESTNGSSVGYTIVTVKRPGAGSARYEYDVPATYGQSATGSWTPTVNRFARGAVQSMGIVSSGGTWMFPHTLNPNYDHYRGLSFKKSEFNEAGVKVRMVETTYQNIFKSGTTEAKVWGLKYDRYAGSDPGNKIYFYGKYFLLTDIQRVPLQETVTTYDATGAALVEATQYLYESTNHKLLTTIKQTTADGKVYTTKTKYAGDYTYTTTGTNEAIMIGNLKNNNRYGTPIEQIQTLQKDGVTSVIGGSVTKFDPFTLNRPIVKSLWVLTKDLPSPIGSFVESSVVNESGYKFKIDPRYEETQTVLSVTSLGKPKAIQNPITRQTSVIGYGYTETVPVVQVVNASDNESAFSDFETTTALSFSNSGTAYYGAGRSGKNALHPNVVLSKTLTKSISAANYILSFWIKSNTTVSFNAVLKNGPTTVQTTPISVTSSGGSDYKYVQKVIPVTAAAGTFTLELSATGLPNPGASSPGLMPVIDDVFFYPENADIAATTYQLPFGATSVTTGTGKGAFKEYDKLGRLRFEFDRERNIVKRNVYQYNTANPLTANFSISPQPYVNQPVTFTALGNQCATDATYAWDVGNGFVTGTSTLQHTFTSPGLYNIRLRVTSPTWGELIVSKPLDMKYSAYEVFICAEGVIGVAGGVDQTTTCDAITTTPPLRGTIFRVYHDGVANTYQWKWRDLGSADWVDVGTNSDQLSIIKIYTRNSFEVKCEVHSTWHSTSPTMQVIVTP